MITSSGLGKLPGGGTNVRPPRSFFGRLLRGIVKIALEVVENSGPIGNLIADEIRSEINSSWLNKTTSDFKAYEPTLAEENKILSFMNTKFFPFYRNLVADLDDAIENTDISIQLLGINEVMAKMCVATEYISKNDTLGLSPSAISYRLDAVKECFNYINKSIYKIIATNQNSFELVSVTITPKPSDYLPLVVSGSNYKCQAYLKKNSVIASGLPTTLDVGTVTNSPSNYQTVVKNNDNSGMWLTVFVVGAVLVTVLSSRDDN